MTLAEMFKSIVIDYAVIDNLSTFKTYWFGMMDACGTVAVDLSVNDTYTARFRDGSVLKFEYSDEHNYIRVIEIK